MKPKAAKPVEKRPGALRTKPRIYPPAPLGYARLPVLFEETCADGYITLAPVYVRRETLHAVVEWWNSSGPGGKFMVQLMFDPDPNCPAELISIRVERPIPVVERPESAGLDA